MSDLLHQWGQDLSVDGTGDLAEVSGSDNVIQTFAHRLLTALGGYLWDLGYGTGLPGMVGQVISFTELNAVISAQAAQEAGIDQTQPVTITPVQTANGVNVQISFTESATGLEQSFILGA